MSSDREKPEQISSKKKYETNKGDGKSAGWGYRRKKGGDVKDYPKVATIGQILKDLYFPADKEK